MARCPSCPDKCRLPGERGPVKARSADPELQLEPIALVAREDQPRPRVGDRGYTARPVSRTRSPPPWTIALRVSLLSTSEEACDRSVEPEQRQISEYTRCTNEPSARLRTMLEHGAVLQYGLALRFPAPMLSRLLRHALPRERAASTSLQPFVDAVARVRGCGLQVDLVVRQQRVIDEREQARVG